MSDAYEDLERKIKTYDGRAFGHEVSEYGLENGYLDYGTLSKIVGGCILNNNIIEYTGYENWDLVLGSEESDIYQYYIISESGYQILDYYTDETVYYNEDLDMFVWGITHFGTGWDYVLTDLKLEE